MSKTIIFLLLVSICFCCNRKPFVTAKFKLEKISADCNNQQTYFKMVSGFAGERYEFERCLDVNYTDKDARVSRQGDTVVILLAKPSKEKSLFKLIVDVDSYPKYNFVTVDGETFQVISTKD